MKKKMLVLIPMVFLLVGCSWFKKTIDDYKEIYMNVLKGELTFINEEKEEKYFKEYTDNGYKISRIAMLDLESDEAYEMAVELKKPSNSLSYLILSRQGGKVYCYDLEDDKVDKIVQSGYFSYTTVDGLGIKTYKFKKNKKEATIYYEINIEKQECIINNKKTSCDKVTDDLFNFEQKDLDWEKYSA